MVRAVGGSGTVAVGNVQLDPIYSVVSAIKHFLFKLCLESMFCIYHCCFLYLVEWLLLLSWKNLYSIPNLC